MATGQSHRYGCSAYQNGFMTLTAGCSGCIALANDRRERDERLEKGVGPEPGALHERPAHLEDCMAAVVGVSLGGYHYTAHTLSNGCPGCESAAEVLRALPGNSAGQVTT